MSHYEEKMIFFIHPCLITKGKDFLYTLVSLRRGKDFFGFFIHPCLMAKGKGFFYTPVSHDTKGKRFSYTPLSHCEEDRIFLYTHVSCPHDEGERILQPCLITKGKVQNEPDRNQLECIGRINQND